MQYGAQPLAIGRWSFFFRVRPDVELQSVRRAGPGWYRFDLALLKMHSWPPDGDIITRKHYQGFWIRFRFWLPFERID